MIKKSLVELVKCRLREFIREPSAAFFVFTMPIVWMIILGLAFSPDKNKEGLHIGAFYQEGTLSVLQTKLIQTLSEKEDIIVMKSSKEDLLKKLRQNEISLILNLNDPYAINYVYDSANPQSRLHRHEVNDILQQSLGRKEMVAIKDSIYTPDGSRYIDFLIPGLLALSLLTTSLFGTGMIIVVSRREKLLQRFLVTPMKPLEYFMSHVISRMMIVFMEVCVILLAGYLLFSFHLKGSFFSYLVLSFLGAACFTSLAILCSSRGKNSSAYSGVANLVVILLMLLSGIWFNRGNFPLWLQKTSQYSPLSALVDGLRKIALEGDGLMELGGELSLIAFYTVIFLFLSRKCFSWL